MHFRIFIVLCLYSVFASAGPKDTTSISKFSFQHFISDTISENIDTTLTNFHLTNDFRQHDNSFLFLSNFGQPAKALKVSYEDFVSPKNQWNGYDYFFSKKSQYFQTRSPFSLINYSFGNIKEHVLQVLHTQNYTQHLNFGVNYSLISSEGTFKRQQARDNGITVWINFISKRYSANCTANYYKLKNLCSGGISSDSIYTQTDRDLATIPVNFEKSNRDLNIQDYKFSQQFVLISRESDSLNFFKISLLHKLQVEKKSSGFYDDDPAHYTNILSDSTSTADTIAITSINNWGAISLAKKSDLFNFQLKVGALSSANKQTYAADKFSFFSDAVFADLKLKTKYFFADGLIQKVVSGYNKNDIFFVAKVGAEAFLLNEKFVFNGIFSSSINTPSLYEQHFNSNAYLWNMKLQPVEGTSFGVELKNEKHFLFLKAEYFTVQNITFFDNTYGLKQYSEKLKFYKIYVSKRFDFWRISFLNNLTYQKSIENKWLNFPDIFSYHAMYFRGAFFKKKLPFHVGFDLYYNSSFYNDIYNPSLNQFCYQENFKTKESVSPGFFLSFQRKYARFFVRFMNLNTIGASRDYYSFYSYPSKGFSFRIGLSWRFDE